MNTAADPRRAIGAAGERLASSHLLAAGYAILDRNFRTRYGELDLVARDRRFLVFCEVKTRVGGAPTSLGPLAAVGPEKQRRLRSMARQWLAERGPDHRPGPAEVRFDAIGVTLDRSGRVLALDHLEDAF